MAPPPRNCGVTAGFAVCAGRVADGQVTIQVPVTKTHYKPGGIVASQWQSDWTFDVVEESGWRICGVTHPKACEMINCAGPAVAPSVTAEIVSRAQR